MPVRVADAPPTWRREGRRRTVAETGRSGEKEGDKERGKGREGQEDREKEKGTKSETECDSHINEGNQTCTHSLQLHTHLQAGFEDI